MQFSFSGFDEKSIKLKPESLIIADQILTAETYYSPDVIPLTETVENTCIRSILFVDTQTVMDCNNFYDYANDQTAVILYDSSLTTRNELSTMLNYFENRLIRGEHKHNNAKMIIKNECDAYIERIGFVFSTNINLKMNKFLENEYYNADANVFFLKSIIDRMNIRIIDFFGCNTLSKYDWLKYYDYLTINTNVTIYANYMETGNPCYGGSWEFDKYSNKKTERITEKIDKYYFNSTISNYKYILDELGDQPIINVNNVTNGVSVSWSQLDPGTTPVTYYYYCDLSANGGASRTFAASGEIPKNTQGVYYNPFTVPVVKSGNYNVYVTARNGAGDISSNYSSDLSVNITKPTLIVNASGINCVTVTSYTSQFPSGNLTQTPKLLYYVDLSSSGVLTRTASGEIPKTTLGVYCPSFTIPLIKSGKYVVYIDVSYSFGDISSNRTTVVSVNLTKPTIVVNATGINCVTVTSYKSQIPSGNLTQTPTLSYYIDLNSSGTRTNKKYGPVPTKNGVYCPSFNIPVLTAGKYNVYLKTTYSIGDISSSYSIDAIVNFAKPTLPFNSGQSLISANSNSIIGKNLGSVLGSDISLNYTMTSAIFNSTTDQKLPTTTLTVSQTTPALNCSYYYNASEYSDILYKISNNRVTFDPSMFSFPTSPVKMIVYVIANTTNNTISKTELSQYTDVSYVTIDIHFYGTYLSGIGITAIVNNADIPNGTFSGTFGGAAQNTTGTIIDTIIYPYIQTTYVPNLYNNVLYLTSVPVYNGTYNFLYYAYSAYGYLTDSFDSGNRVRLGFTNESLTPLDLSNSDICVGRYIDLYDLDGTPKFSNYYSGQTISRTGILNRNQYSFKIPLKPLLIYKWMSDFTAVVVLIRDPKYYFDNISKAQFLIDISFGRFNAPLYMGTFGFQTISQFISNFYAGPKIYNLKARTFDGTTLSVDFDLSGSSNPSPALTYFVAKDASGLTSDVSGRINLPNYPGTNEIISYYDNRLSRLLPNTTYNIYIYNYYKSPVVTWKIISETVQQRTAYVGAAPTIVLTPSLNCIVVDFSQNPQGYPTPKYSYSIDNGLNYTEISSDVFNFLHQVNSINSVSFTIKSDNSGGTISSVISGSAFISSTPYITNITPGLNSLFVNFFTNNCNPSSGIKYYYQTATYTSGGDISQYSDREFIGTDVSTVLVPTSTSTNFKYSVKIIADALYEGQSVWTTSDVSSSTPYFTGNKPTILSIEPSLNQLTVYNNLSLGGNPTSGIKYYYSLDGLLSDPIVTDSSYRVFSGLSNDLHTISIIAKYIDNTGYTVWTSLEDVSSATPYYAGTAPFISSATPLLTTNGIEVSFTETTGGNPLLTKYQYSLTSTTNGTQIGDVIGTRSPITITGLSGGTTYRLLLRALSGTKWISLDSNSIDVTTYKSGSAPSITRIEPSINQVTVYYNLSTGGVPDTDIRYYYTLNNGLEEIPVVGNSGPYVTIQELLNQTYSVLIIARSYNDDGDLAWTSVGDPSLATPYYPGTAPSILSAVSSGSSSIIVSFTESSGGNPPLTNYQYLLTSSSGEITGIPTQSHSPITIQGLSSGISYTIRLKAVSDQIWETDYSEATTAIIQNTGTPPYITRIIPGLHELTVYNTLSSGGYPTTGITYEYYLDNDPSPSFTGKDSISHTFTNLSNRQYKISIIAKYIDNNNSQVWRSAADVSYATPYYEGTTPSILSAVSYGLTSIMVSFTASSGGNPQVTNYQYLLTLPNGRGTQTGFVSNSPLRIDRLSSGTYYTIELKALSGTIWETVYSPFAGVTTYNSGGAPSIYKIEPALNQLTVYNTLSSGGYPTTGITYEYYLDNDTSPSFTGKDSTSHTFTNLSDREYKISITAKYIDNNNSEVWNSVGGPSYATPYYAGTPPSYLSAIPLTTTNGIQVSFTRTTGGNPPFTKYQYLLSSTDGTQTGDVFGTISPIKITGLSYGKYYTVSLRAVSETYSGTKWQTIYSASAGVTTYKTGEPPYIQSIEPSLNKLTVTNSLSVNGYPTTDITYRYYLDGSLSYIGKDSSNAVFSNLSNKLYTVSITAQYYDADNILIWTAGRDSLNATPYYAGTTPSNLSAVPSDLSSIIVSFTESTGGNPKLTKYQYSLNSTNGQQTGDVVGTNSPIRITDLSSGTYYTIALKALSGTIWETIYSPSAGVTTYKTGNKPIIQWIEPALNQLTVYNSLSSGGYPTTGITYDYYLDGSLSYTGTDSKYAVFTSLSNDSHTISITATYRDKSGFLIWTSIGDPSSATPYYAGTPPSDLSAIPLTTTNEIEVSFTESSGGYPPFTKYQYLLNSTDGTQTGDVVGTNSPIRITGLSYGKYYTVSLRAVSETYSGTKWQTIYSASAGVTTPNEYQTGNIPAIQTIEPSLNKLTVTNSLSVNGYPTSGITYSYYLDGSLSYIGTDSSHVVFSNLSNKLYTVSITAQYYDADNILIWTAVRDSLNETPYYAGTTPSKLSAVPSDLSSIIVSFTESTGGNPKLTKYQYLLTLVSTDETKTGDVFGSPIRITNLYSGTYYTIALKAISGTIWETIYSPSAGVTTYKTGNKPIIQWIEPSLNKLTVYNSLSLEGNPTSGITYDYYLDGALSYTGTDSKYAVFTSLSNDSHTISITATYYDNCGNLIWTSVGDPSSATPYYAGTPPTSLSATPFDLSSIQVLFTESSGGNPPLTNYQYSLNGTQYIDTSYNQSPIIITGLSSGRYYKVSLRALSGTNWISVVSQLTSVITYKTGNAPYIERIDPSLNTLIVYNYLSKGSNPKSGITYNYYLDGSLSYFGIDSSNAVFSNLSNKLYTISINAQYYDNCSNLIWTSSMNSLVATPYYVGTTPSDLSAVPFDLSSIKVSFTESSGGNPKFTKYQYLLTSVSTSDTQIGYTFRSPFIINGLSNGTNYTVSLKALSGKKWQTIYSPSAGVTTYKIGNKPTIQWIEPSLNKLTVYNNLSSGGYPTSNITYDYYLDGSLSDTRTDSSYAVFSGLSNYSHRISIIAKYYDNCGNLIWTSLADSSNATPYYAGTAPSDLSATPFDLSSIKVSFTESSGGNPPVTKYQYSLSGGEYTDTDYIRSPIIITGLSSGTYYTVSLRALSDTKWISVDSKLTSVITYKTGNPPYIQRIEPSLNTLIVYHSLSLEGNPTSGITYDYYIDSDFAYSLKDSSYAIFSRLSDNEHKITINAKYYDNCGNLIWTSPNVSSNATPYWLGSTPLIKNIIAGQDKLYITFDQTYLGTLPTTFYYSIDGVKGPESVTGSVTYPTPDLTKYNSKELSIEGVPNDFLIENENNDFLIENENRVVGTGTLRITIPGTSAINFRINAVNLGGTISSVPITTNAYSRGGSGGDTLYTESENNNKYNCICTTTTNI
jgi:hypothetical protein